MDKIKEFLEQLEIKPDEEVKEILKLNDDIWILEDFYAGVDATIRGILEWINLAE